MIVEVGRVQVQSLPTNALAVAPSSKIIRKSLTKAKPRVSRYGRWGVSYFGFSSRFFYGLISLTKRIGGGPLVLISQRGQLGSSSGSPRSPTRTHVIGCHLRRLNITPCLGSALRKGSISHIDKYSSSCNHGTEFC